MVAQDKIIAEIETKLQGCGYTNSLLEREYFYEDGMGKHIVPVAGFASPVHDSRTSCISVIGCEGLGDVTPEYVNQYRGLGAPVVFVCCDGTVQWWSVQTGGAEHERTILKKELEGFFESQKEKFAPERIWRAKNLGRLDKDQQLGFVDIGLMPLLEHEMGERLGGLMNGVISLLKGGFSEKQLKEADSQRWIFQAGFWVLCAKILKDKGVRNFVRLRIDDINAVLEAVKRHYGSQEEVQIENVKERKALERAADNINKFASLSNLTTEAFGYMYEDVLVDKDLRRALGIHATPSYLVDYIVWQLWPWVKEIPEDKRVILEPACGHAPFLTAAMRLLRFLYTGREEDFHRYAKNSMIGIELDSFAREIARPSLTMADVPNPNGWKIVGGDVYRGDVLSRSARNAMILLCNPPFEDFTPAEQEVYRRDGQQLRCFNKAGEMLWRTLPYMPEGSVFGVILPRGFVNRTDLAELRGMILSDFEVQQICCLPKKVFRHAKHESVVLSGRKKTGRAQRDSIGEKKVLYRQVLKEGLERFQEKYEGRDEYVLQSKFVEGGTFDFRVRELDDVWDYCERNLPKLGSISEGGQGLTYKGRDLPEGAKTFDKEKFTGAVEGYARFDKDVQLHELPRRYWMSLAPEVIRRPMWGKEIGRSQIVMNYAPVDPGPWRLKALLDRKGRPVRDRFLVFRVKSSEWSLNALWGILNSALANAFIYAHTTDRDISAGTARKIPVPACSRQSLEKLERLVSEYFTLMEKRNLQFGIDVGDAAKHLLLWIDAEVMRLYDLPPKMEKRILDLFQGVQRKGVDFSFTGYYPEGFESAIPLHEYLSEEYQRSTVAFADEWVKKHRSAEMNAILRNAVEAFEED
ncbi:MAG TPA: N-6 DNA methylase [Sedimentisphaerales bacterium]|nr:N-6 DNA methylase [Sedimentisphaerales bacterium]